MDKKPIVGIIGVGRLGSAIAARMPKQITLFLADILEDRAAELAGRIDAQAKSVIEIFGAADIIILTTKPSEICHLVKEYSLSMKSGAFLLNMSTSVPTAEVLKCSDRKDIRIIGAKPICQAYAISRGHEMLIVSTSDEPTVMETLTWLFCNLGDVMSGDEMLVKKINDEATRLGLKLAINLEGSLKEMGATNEMINIAKKTVAVGTILDYPAAEENEYIKERLKEI